MVTLWPLLALSVQLVGMLILTSGPFTLYLVPDLGLALICHHLSSPRSAWNCVTVITRYRQDKAKELANIEEQRRYSFRARVESRPGQGQVLLDRQRLSI